MFLLLIKCNIRVSPNKPYSTLEMNLGVLLLNLSGVYSPLVLTHQTHRTRDSNICGATDVNVTRCTMRKTTLLHVNFAIFEAEREVEYLALLGHWNLYPDAEYHYGIRSI